MLTAEQARELSRVNGIDSILSKIQSAVSVGLYDITVPSKSVSTEDIKALTELGYDVSRIMNLFVVISWRYASS